MSRAPKAKPTSDVMRPRGLALAAVGAGIGALVAVVAEGKPPPERPVALPHAKLACASCHAPAAPVATTCAGCHGEHASTRAAHRSLAAKGALGCPTCHAQHANAQGLTFAEGAVVRWAAGAERKVGPAAPIASGTTVPLVAVSACTTCHDATRSSDPIAACLPAKGSAIACFDEHARAGEAKAARGPCQKQHGATRFAAWDLARTIAETTPPVASAQDRRRPWRPLAGAVAGALVLGLGLRPRQAKAPARAKLEPAARRKLPVIDPTTCLGCYACVDACPFDVLAIEKYVAVVERPAECCGVLSCAEVCPNGSLRIEEGEPLLDRPATDDLESRDVPGLFVAGDLTGLPLIKNAINQGVRAIDRIATRPRRKGGLDVVIIGAGPAGLSAALRAKERGLSYVVLEQATVAASIKSFPRDKIVHDPPLDLPVEGSLWLAQSSKEELLAQWTRIVRAQALVVREQHRVVDVQRADGIFSVATEQARFEAPHVVLAIGRRGTPRTLDLAIEPGCEDRISYALADARSFEGKRVVVVGLGDTAMEAAIALARQPGTRVALVHRGAGFERGKTKNIKEVQALAGKGAIDLRLGTTPVGIGPRGVALGSGAVVPADAMLVLIGGAPSWDLLQRAGIRRPGHV